ncbi:MAG: hypothetical protein WC791_01155 [Candidatus Paceibacterota bacterium]|jgi:hypothetical protein
MKIVCEVVSGKDLACARRLSQIVSNDPELAGTTIVIHQKQLHAPRVNVVTIGHLSHGMGGLTQAIVEILRRDDFDIPCGTYVPKKMDTQLFARIRKEHTRHSRHEIKRLSLNPRVMKKSRKHNFR